MYVVLSALLVHSCGYAQTGVVTGDDHDARNPYISSLRCNLQRKHIERLIDMSMPSNGFGSAAAPVQNLGRMHLENLNGRTTTFLNQNKGGLDPYTEVHLRNSIALLDRVQEAQYIYNSNEMGGGGTTSPRRRGPRMEHFPFDEDVN
jgi:hypothetical protein